MPSVNHVLLRDINTGLILRTIQESGPISRSEIAKCTSLAQSTVSVITGELMKREFIRECGRATSTIGRRRVLLEINPDGGHFLCADLSQADLQIGVLDLGLNIRKEWTYPVSIRKGESLYQELEHALTLVWDWCKTNQLYVLGIGVSTPGLVDGSDGRVVEAHNLDWFDVDIGDRLKNIFGCEVVVENDANAAAFGEFKYGVDKNRSISNMLYLSFWSGIGAGMVLSGMLYSGSSGMAGEIGHVIVNPEGSLCTCGKRGCLETYASSTAIEKEYAIQANLEKPSVSTQEIVNRAHDGDEVAQSVIRRAGQVAGGVVGNSINLLNLDTIVVAGWLTDRSVMWESFVAGVNASMLPTFQKRLDVRLASLGRDAALIGVASLNFERLVNVAGFFTTAQ